MVSSYGMKALPIEKALELYDILGKYLPEFDKDSQVLEFVGTIVDNIVNDGSTAYVDSICLMTNKSFSEIRNFSPNTLIEIFTLGLVINDIVSLKSFCEEINYVA